MLGQKINDIDNVDGAIASGDAIQLQAERSSLPYLVSGTALPLSTGLITHDMQDEARYFSTIRQLVESVRRARNPLGYFIRPLRGYSLTGLLPLDGSGDKTHAYFAAIDYNQPRVIAVRLGKSGKPEVTLINNAGPVGVCALTLMLTLPNGLTEIIRSDISHDITVKGERVQDLSNELAPLQTTRNGEYHLQYILSTGTKVIALSQVITFTVRDGIVQ